MANQNLGLTLAPTSRSSNKSGSNQLSYLWSNPTWISILPPVLDKDGELNFVMWSNSNNAFSVDYLRTVPTTATVELKIGGTSPVGTDLQNYTAGTLSNNNSWRWGPYSVPTANVGARFRVWIKITNAGSGINGTYTVDPEMVIGDGSNR